MSTPLHDPLHETDCTISTLPLGSASDLGPFFFDLPVHSSLTPRTPTKAPESNS